MPLAAATLSALVFISALPRSVRDAIRKAYPGGKTTKSEKIIKDDKVQYEVVVRTGKETQELVYELDGTLTKTEKK